MESFFGSMQIELLDRRSWATRADLANAIPEWIEPFSNPTRRHSALGYLSPDDYGTKPFTLPRLPRHDHHTNTVRRTGKGSVSTVHLSRPVPVAAPRPETPAAGSCTDG